MNEMMRHAKTNKQCLTFSPPRPISRRRGVAAVIIPTTISGTIKGPIVTIALPHPPSPTSCHIFFNYLAFGSHRISSQSHDLNSIVMKTANGIPDGVDADLWNTDYVDEEYVLQFRGLSFANNSHLAAFAQALELNDTQPTEGDISPHALKSPPLSTADANAPEWTRGGVEKLTATSDFAVSTTYLQ